MKPTTLLLPLILLLFGAAQVLAQPPKPSAAEPPELTYEQRIRRTKLNNVHIPANMAEAFVQLNRLMEPAAKAKFKAMPEELVAQKLHFSFGRWIMKNWSFYEGSRFSHYLKSMGIHNPDDMADFVMVAYHRHVNDRPLDIKPLIIHFVERRAALERERKLRGEVLHKEVRKREE